MQNCNSNPIKSDSKFKIIKVLFIVLIFNFSLLTFNLSSAKAGFSLSASPLTIDAKIEPGKEFKSSFTLENKDQQPIDLSISYQSFSSQKNGEGVVFNGKELPIFKHIHVLEENQPIATLTLSPQQKKTLTLSIDDQVPLTDDSYFAVIFEHVPSVTTSHTSVTIAPSIALLVFASSKNSHASGIIEQFSTSPFIQKGPVPFTLRIKNNSSSIITPKGFILIKNVFGQIVGKINLPASRILGQTTRTIPNIEWNSGFILGPYQAVLSLSYSDNGADYTSSLRFLAVPFYLLLIIILVAISLTFVSRRLKKRFK